MFPRQRAGLSIHTVVSMVTAAVSSLSVFEVRMGLSPDPEPMLHDAHPALFTTVWALRDKAMSRHADSVLSEYMEYKSVQG